MHSNGATELCVNIFHRWKKQNVTIREQTGILQWLHRRLSHLWQVLPHYLYSSDRLVVSRGWQQNVDILGRHVSFGKTLTSSRAGLSSHLAIKSGPVVPMSRLLTIQDGREMSLLTTTVRISPRFTRFVNRMHPNSRPNLRGITTEGNDCFITIISNQNKLWILID